MKYMRYDVRDSVGNNVDTIFSFFCKVSGYDYNTYKITLPKSLRLEQNLSLGESFNVRMCLIDCVPNPDPSHYTRRSIKDVSFVATVRGTSSHMYLTVPRRFNDEVSQFILCYNHRPWCQVVLSRQFESPVTPFPSSMMSCVNIYDRVGECNVNDVGLNDSEHLLDYIFTFVGSYGVVNDRVVFGLPGVFKKYSTCYLGYWTTKNLCWNVDVYDASGKRVYSNDSYPIVIDGRPFLYFRNRDDDFILKKPIDYEWKIELKCIGYY